MTNDRMYWSLVIGHWSFPKGHHVCQQRLLARDAPSLALLALPAAAAGGLRGGRVLPQPRAARIAPQRRRQLAAPGAGPRRPAAALLDARPAARGPRGLAL